MRTGLDEFKARLGTVLSQLENPDRRDSEAMFRIGQLAAAEIDRLGVHSWREVKNTLGPERRDALLARLQTRGHELAETGDAAGAYAIRVLALSIIARTINDPVVTEGEDVLDPIIALATSAFRSTLARFGGMEDGVPPGEVID